MSMRTLLSEVRTALTSYSGLTDLIPANKITFARRPQRDEMPGLTVTLGNVDYEPVFTSYAAATTYRVDVTIFGRSADETTEIHDQVKLAFLAANSSNFKIRIFDERYFVDVDNNHQGYVSATWEMASGLTNNTTTILSPAFQGYDRMDINYDYNVSVGGTTALSATEQVYFFDFASASSQATHTVTLPKAEENLGKIYTILMGNNVDNNTLVQLSRFPGSSETVEGNDSYDLNRAHSAVNVVAIKTSDTTYGWRIWAYHGLHD